MLGEDIVGVVGVKIDSPHGGDLTGKCIDSAVPVSAEVEALPLTGADEMYSGVPAPPS